MSVYIEDLTEETAIDNTKKYLHLLRKDPAGTATSPYATHATIRQDIRHQVDTRDWVALNSPGTNDVATEMQAAITQSITAGLDLFIPKTTYYIGSTLALPSALAGKYWHMRGEGGNNGGGTILLYTGATGSLFEGVAADVTGSSFFGGFGVHNIMFQMSHATNTDPLVRMQGMINAFWEQCRFYTLGKASIAALNLDYNCITSMFLQCDFQGSDGNYALKMDGVTNSYPNLNKFIGCSFVDPGLDKLYTGVYLNGASTNFFEACQFEGLLLAVKMAHPYGNCIGNVFIEPRIESCGNEIDHANNGSYTMVFGRRTISNDGGDLNTGGSVTVNPYVREFSVDTASGRLTVSAYSGTDTDQIRYYSNHENSGLVMHDGTFGDWTTGNRRLAIYSQSSAARIRNWGSKLYLLPQYGITYTSDNPTHANSVFDLNVPVRLGQFADSAAQNDSWYYSTTQSKPAYKDGSGNVFVMTAV